MHSLRLLHRLYILPKRKGKSIPSSCSRGSGPIVQVRVADTAKAEGVREGFLESYDTEHSIANLPEKVNVPRDGGFGVLRHECLVSQYLVALSG